MMGKSVSVFLLAAISAGAHALGLGNILLNSNLNQPLDARIELLSPTQAELDSLNISLADGAAFSRAGIEYVPVLAGLRFQVIESDTGPDYIRVTSREPVREPYLNFLLQANWSNGRLYREYTVLLDPPLYDPNAGRVASGAAGGRTAPVAEEPAASPPARQTPAPAGAPAQSPGRAAAPAPAYRGGEYGPVSSNESLWSIANRVRPDDSVSTQQMMLALLRANPEAFIDNNINGLRQGQVLRVPERDEISGSSRQQAYTEVRSQNAAWEEMRGALAAGVATRPQGPGTQPAGTGSATAGMDDSSELRLVAPGNEAQGGGQSGAAVNTAAGENYALMDEQLQALGSENAELRDRLQESEALIDDLRRLIELKDDELATLQQQAAGMPGEQTAAGTGPDTAAGENGMTDGGDTDVAGSAGPSQPAEPVTPRVETPAPPPAVPPATATSQQPAPAQPGLVDQALGFIQGNILMVGGAAGGIALAVLLLLFVRNRRAVPPEEDYPEAEFDRLEATADETGMPRDEATDAPSGADTTIFIGEDEQPEAAHETAAGAAAEEAGSPPAAGQETGEDPLAEVNVFLAYEHFDQAEEFVRDAITRDPDNLDFHGKLLEVFYSSGDKAKYEEEARVLQGLTGGEGPHWEMALIMWQEMSPNRALFAERAGDEAEEAPREDVTTGRGIVDLTADEDAGEDAELDFDLGIGAGGGEAGQDRGEGPLDLTANQNAGREDVLDVTASEARQEQDEDLLDITAAVGLDRLDDSVHHDMLDVTGNGSVNEETMLDISSPGGDDLLDVTAHADLEADGNEDLLDLTAAGKAGDELLDLKEPAAAGGDNSLDFDIGGLDQAQPVEEGQAGAAAADNVIDFESAGGEPEDDFGISLDAVSGESGDDFGLSLDQDSGDEIKLEPGGGIELDLESGAQDEAAEFSLDAGDGGDDFGIELDAGEDNPGGAQDFGLSLEGDGIDQGDPAQDLESTLKLSAGGDDDDFGLSLDEDDSGAVESGLEDESTLKLSMEDGDGDGDYGVSLDEGDADSGLDAGSTLKLSTQDFSIEEEEGDTIKLTGKESALSLDDEEDDDEDGDHTVFVPRTGDAREQSAEDEVATKLDLAKAYVELGDNDSAKAILEEVITDGTEKQRRQAQDLLGQIA